MRTDETAESASGKNPFHILSLDGGGLKGLFTACFLAEWERITERRVVESFDLISGTSAGGIIALALGAGFSAEEVVDFFKKHGATIFPSRPAGSRLIRFIRRMPKSGYSPKPLEKVLKCYFDDKRLKDSIVRLVIPAYHVERGIYIFKTPHYKRLLVDGKERMTDVACATSSAPTYFPPMQLEHGLRLVDGGIWANNPIQIAINEALGHLDIPQSRISALRIGTGRSASSVKEYPRDPGIFCPRNSRLFINLMMRGQSLAASGGARCILGSERFIEVDPVVHKDDHRLDELSKSLCGLAKTEFRKVSSDLEEHGFLAHKSAPPCFSSPS